MYTSAVGHQGRPDGLGRAPFADCRDGKEVVRFWERNGSGRTPSGAGRRGDHAWPDVSDVRVRQDRGLSLAVPSVRIEGVRGSKPLSSTQFWPLKGMIVILDDTQPTDMPGARGRRSPGGWAAPGKVHSLVVNDDQPIKLKIRREVAIIHNCQSPAHANAARRCTLLPLMSQPLAARHVRSTMRPCSFEA